MQRRDAMTRVPYDSEVQPLADWFMATYGPTMPARVLPMARAAFEQQRLARGLDEHLAGHRVSARTFEVPGDETGPASEVTVFSPEPVAAGRGVFYIHGGGMVMGHRLDNADDHIALVEQLQVPVIA